ncbi:MAG: hypothetical protein Q9172_000098 [Xanthocarpia lactea]
MDQDCQNLRLELKEWENSFAITNGGKKAGREDIKQYPEIAAKYKLYHKLRAQGKDDLDQVITSVQDQPPKKRHASKPPPAIARTPQKRSKHLHSPPSEKAVTKNATVSAQNTPVAHRKSIGPTPQRNGHVLGLFDLLTPSSSLATPSKRQTLLTIPPNLVDTPVRTKSTLDHNQPKDPTCSPGKRTRSPSSALKSNYTASFFTPSTRRIADLGDTLENAKPVSVLRYDDTPAFLKRNSQKFSQSQPLRGTSDQIEDDVFSWSPVAVRTMRPKPAGRGLSALVKGLRDMEEAKLDDELEMLREMEGQEGNDKESQAKDIPNICVEDSQVPDMPLGPDGEGESEGEDLEALKTEGRDRSGRPLKVWKKKGQKRTTRRVTIRPNTAKWKPEQEWTGGKEDESEEEIVAVRETQFSTSGLAIQAAEAEDFKTDEDGLSEDACDNGKQQSRSHKKDTQRPKASQKEPTKEKKKKVVNPAAHTNYRALKIKNKNSKGKGSGRYGRRR